MYMCHNPWDFAPHFRYDALLAAGNDWIKLGSHGMFHGGDNDSTAVIAAACFGAMYGFINVPILNYQVSRGFNKFCISWVKTYFS